MSRTLSLGISPCPNDTFIFHALLHGLARPDYPEDIAISLRIADVEELNALALEGKLAFSKVSVGVAPYILDKYMLLSSGGALGFGCGPIVVAKSGDADPRKATMATPGAMTTANLLLNLHGGFGGARRNILFSEIMPAILHDEAEMGIIIHEGRFTYREHGLRKIIDMGEWWENTYNMPLPLGVIAVRRDIGARLARAMEKAIAQSLEYARNHPAASRAFVAMNAREMSEEVINAHINTFVTDYSHNLREEGREAIRKLLLSAAPNLKDKIANDLFLE